MLNSFSNDEDYFLFSYTVFEFHIDNIVSLKEKCFVDHMHKKMLIASHECLEVEDYQTNKYGNNSFICSQSPPPLFCFALVNEM